ncbi:hypothetical protein [Haladaptatus sp. R4]|uniref:hypothetical protein n=1 Tax=Haladaptatus sp. R4 TaxID=1679489 RepID=UPI000A99B82F|nr:hypothetical protein [Haladaptatus sp. R4]
MEEKEYSGGSNGRTNRRTILKTGALGMTSLVTGTGFASAKLNEKRSRGSAVYTAKASGGAAVSDEQRRAVRRRAADDFAEKNGRAPAVIPASEQETSSGGVVAYAYGFDADGVGHSYVGVAAEDMTEPQAESGRSEALIHDQLDSHVADISSTIKASEQVTTMAGGTVSSTDNMEQMFSQKLEYADDPYGTVGATFYVFMDTLGSSEGDVFALHSPAGSNRESPRTEAITRTSGGECITNGIRAIWAIPTWITGSGTRTERRAGRPRPAIRSA